MKKIANEKQRPGQGSEDRSERFMYPTRRFVGYNIPLFYGNYKTFFEIFTEKYAENRIFGETHKFEQKFPAN